MIKIAYFLLTLVSFFVFFIFRPYSIIDHSETKIACSNNSTNYKLGENFLYLFNKEFDSETDKNVKNLCGNSTYSILPISERRGSFREAIIMSLAVFSVGIYCLKNINKGSIISILMGLVVCFSFLKTTASSFYCERQIAGRVGNFRRSAYGFGWVKFQNEQSRINQVIIQAFKTCLEKEGVK